MSLFPEELVVLDFETSGMAPQRGDRAIEIGAVKIRDNRIVERFESLMNPGFAVDSFIEEFTGITNAQLAQAPPAEEVMREFSRFIGRVPLVAHNASFDQRFLQAELERVGDVHPRRFGCSMLVARRVYPEAPNHKLATLVAYKGLPCEGTFHRALADAEMTAYLWLQMSCDLCEHYQCDSVSFDILSGLGRVPIKKVAQYFEKVLHP